MLFPNTQNELYSNDWTDDELIELVDHHSRWHECEAEITYNSLNPEEYRWKAKVDSIGTRRVGICNADSMLRALGWAVLNACFPLDDSRD